MDSMRSLNTSLPRSSPRRRRLNRNHSSPPELLAAFKAAALSVTQLYKTAAADQENIRASGYQDALDDLLSFLDQENLGLGDGEGWQVRQWATERLSSGVMGGFEGTGSDGEEDEEIKRPRSSSPAQSRQAHNQQQEEVQNHNIPQPDMTPRAESSPPTSAPTQPTSSTQQMETTSQPIQDISDHQADQFTFRSTIDMPSSQDIDMESTSTSNNTTTTPSTVHIELVPTPGSRPTSRKHNLNSSVTASHPARERERIPGSTASNLGPGAGAKRKTPFGEFFDFSSLGFANAPFGKDGGDATGGGGGGRGKKGRFT